MADACEMVATVNAALWCDSRSGEDRAVLVDNVFNPRYGQRGFRDVGRQHNTPSTVRSWNTVSVRCSKAAHKAASIRYY
ncbi:hypothetical protein ACNKHU_10635 [Shigella flexneri]